VVTANGAAGFTSPLLSVIAGAPYLPAAPALSSTRSSTMSPTQRGTAGVDALSNFSRSSRWPGPRNLDEETPPFP